MLGHDSGVLGSLLSTVAGACGKFSIYFSVKRLMEIDLTCE
jgi:hypothetical protein